MQNKQATKLEQLKQTSKQAKNAQKQEEQAKELKRLKQGVVRCLIYIVCLPTPKTYQRSPLLNNPTFPFSSISTLRYFHMPTFGRQVILGQHFLSLVIKANRIGRVMLATRYLNSSTLREVDHLYVRLVLGLRAL